MKTKEFLRKTGISEPTLRRYLRPDGPIPELLKVTQDWRRHREWTEKHVKLVLDYKEKKLFTINEKKHSKK
ncbi:MAG: hypothetical protein Q8K51_00035, partial [Nitrospirota bacterium]|nr:hypothetical protein [Nitrospirota bacterium]